MSSTRMQMMNLRDRKNMDQQGDNYNNPQIADQQQDNNGLKLSLPEQEAPVYQPSSSNGISFQSRTATRLLKGKFDRGSSQEQKFHSTANSEQPFQQVKAKLEGFKPEQSNGFGTSITGHFGPKNSVPEPSNEGLKLFLPDEQDYSQPQQKKLTSLLKLTEPKQQPSNKRIFIQKKQQIKEPVKEVKQPEVHNLPPPPQKQIEKPLPPKIQQIPIGEFVSQNKQELEDDLIENENELVECPEGCGRKFNKKALETHQKACKLVFMSKRKEFNSQAKRVTSKEQAVMVKQSKQKEKKEVQTKIQKNGEAWKTQSEGFRAVIKAIKKQNVGQQGEEQKEVGSVTCEYCQKKFSEILISKHIPICEVKKEKQKKLAKKASKK